MALLFMDGFDRYGPANAAGATSYLQAEYTTVLGALATTLIVAGLSATGSAFLCTSGGGVTKTLGGNYARLIAGFRFSSNLGSSAGSGITFFDAGTAQASVTINASTGTISVKTGTTIGTVVATSTASVTANSTHYLEVDITFSNTGAYQVWLDGTSILSGTGDMTGTANNFANGFGLNAQTSALLTIDDFYLFDTSGTANNAVLLTSPRIETQFPSSDAAVQFAVGAASLGVGGTASRGVNPAVAAATASLVLRGPLVPVRACTLTAISWIPLVTNAAARYAACVYADSAGSPGALLGSGSTVTGAVSGTAITAGLTSGVSLTAGTPYWLGFITDVGTSNHASYELTGFSKGVANTYASGPPATAPAMTTHTNTFLVWGSVTGTGANYPEVGQNPTSGNLSYVYDATVGHEDLYGFPALSAPPSAIYMVAVKASASKSDAGAKTMSLRTKSGATDSAGSAGTALAPATSYTWATSYFQTDPNTGAAWTLPNLNAATAGVKVET